MAAESSQITIQICLNTNRSITKMCKIECVSSNDKFYKKLIQLTKQKLRIKRKKKAQPLRLFLIQTGQEITIKNINQLISHQYAKQFKTTLSISVSLGEEYQGKIVGKIDSICNDICLLRHIVSSTQISSDACKQLEACQRLQGMKLVVGQPDLHSGKGYPIGVSLISEKYVYPYLIGTDIGCGMSLIETPIDKDMANLQRINRWVNDIKLDDAWIHQIRSTQDMNENDKEEFMKNMLKNKLMDWPKNENQDGIDIDRVIDHGINIHDFDATLGTIGHGNHFAELQCIEEIVDENLCKELGLNQNKLFLMIHSGSRGFGACILDNYLKTHSAQKGLDVNSDDFKKYMILHDNALKWARKNRMVIAQRFINCMGSGSGSTYDFNQCICHIDIYHNWLCGKGKDHFKDTQREIQSMKKNKNKINENEDNGDDNNHDKLDKTKDEIQDKNENEIDTELMNKDEIESKLDEMNKLKIDEVVEKKQNDDNDANDEIKTDVMEDMWYIHRKGAAPSDCGYIVIPGSRGSYSYIVKPNGSGNEYSGYSVAHGAGRKLMRSQAVKKMSKWYPNVNVLTRTEKFGSYVICEDKSLMYQEAPQCYKNITNVINDLVEHNLVRVVAILKPIITYKTKGKDYRSKQNKHYKRKHPTNNLLNYDD